MDFSKIVCVYLLLIAQASATIVRIDDLQQMVERSDVIAHVVVGEQSQKIDQENRPIELTTVEVIEGIKGLKTGQLATIFQIGSVEFESPTRIAGQSRFELGEEFVLFGMKYNDMIVTYGVGIGKFKVFRSGEDAKVVEDFQELLAVTKDKDGVHFGAPTPRRFPSLGQFKSAIFESLNAPWQVLRTGPKAVRKTK